MTEPDPAFDIPAEALAAVTPSYMRDHGLALIGQGYRDIIPIRPGGKFPVIDDFLTITVNEKVVDRWTKNGHAKDGIGLRAKHFPGCDIDCLDAAVIGYMMNWISCEFNFPLFRFGNKPKVLIPFRSSIPFRKITGRHLIDTQGRKAQIEFLGDGQQYVVFHTHPGTGKPYTWKGESLFDVRADELPEIDEARARAIVGAFERHCIAQGYTVKVGVGSSTVVALRDKDDPFDIDDLPIQNITDDRFIAMVDELPNDETVDYEGPGFTWLNVMFAIHHQLGDAGEDVARRWAEKSPKHEEEAGRFDKTWKSAGKNAERRNITGRSILKWHKEFVAEAKALVVDDIVDRLSKADETTLPAIVAECRGIDLDTLQREGVIEALQTAWRRVKGRALQLAKARAMVRYTRPDGAPLPAWANGWVYLSSPHRFFNIANKEMLKPEAFGLAHAVHTPGVDAGKYALERLRLPVHYEAAYAPMLGSTFQMDGHAYVNTYSEEGIPAVPAKLSAADRAAIARVEKHFHNLVGDKREAEIAISWVAFIAQTRDKLKWALALQSAEGAGKSLLTQLMANVLGPRNVGTVSARVIMESPFNGWAHGHLLVVKIKRKSPPQTEEFYGFAAH